MPARLLDRGRSSLALRLVDELAVGDLDLFVVRRCELLVLVGRGLGAARGRSFDASDQVAHHLFGDVESALELGDSFRRRLEHEDVVRPLAKRVDGVRETAAAPRAHLDDLAALLADRAGRPIEDGLDAILRHVRTEDEHQLITTHESGDSFPWESPRLRVAAASAAPGGAERTVKSIEGRPRTAHEHGERLLLSRDKALAQRNVQQIAGRYA